MKELNELVQNKLNEMAESGAIEQLVSDQVEKLVANALSDTFRSYSPLSKKLEEAFKTGLDVDFGKIDYASYNQIMLTAVQGHIDKYFGEQMRKDLDEQIENLLSVPPKEISLADLADNIVKLVRDNLDEEDDYLSSISFELDERSYGNSLSVKLDTNGSEKEICNLYLGSDPVATIKINHRHNHSFNPTWPCGLEGAISAYIFKLYAAKTAITKTEGFDPDDHYSEARCED